MKCFSNNREIFLSYVHSGDTNPRLFREGFCDVFKGSEGFSDVILIFYKKNCEES